MIDPGRRDIGRIGFEHISIRREGRSKPSNLQRAREGHGAAKSEHATEIDEGRGLLDAAVEGMSNTASRTQAAKMLEHTVLGTAHMHDHRQVKVAGDAKLLDEKALLFGPIKAGYEMIESDLADSDQTRIADRPADRLTQGDQFGIGSLIDMKRMDAERIAHALMARSKRGDRRKIEGANRRHHDAGNARGQGRIDHVIPVRIEFGGIEVAVGIDEHRCASFRPVRPK
jgi:hypothetical protein